ncbi:MAG: hypothetical protein F6J93_29900 [Oscillatoria sp. SIO1A7]|nr:hypothetical protein [Oscillatoria sp. SIO1A7]
MGPAILVSQEIEEGRRFIDALNAGGISGDSALWIYSSEKEAWQLMLTSTLYDSQGPLKAYGEILSVFRQVKPELKIDRTALVAVSPQNEIIKGLREVQENYNLNLAGRKMFVGQVAIDDAYIYQIK